MTAPEARRRPLPALILLLTLSVLAGVVWYHVLNRQDGAAADSPPTTCVPTASASSSSTATAKQLPAPSQVSLIVLNSTERDGLAGRAQAALEQRGFTVTDAANDTRPYGGHGVLRSVGEIRYARAKARAARLLQYYLPGVQLRPRQASGSGLVLALGRRFHGIATNARARHALQHDGWSVASPVQPAPSTRC